MATKAGVVTISHLQDMVDRGVLLGMQVNYYRGGYLAGEKAIRILRGESPSSIPIEPQKEYGLALNLKTLSAGRFRIPQKVMERVTMKIK
jgi:putative ABC transport system substrate-binding protein